MIKSGSGTEKSLFIRYWPSLALLLCVGVFYPALVLSFGQSVPFGGRADLQYVLGAITHLLKSDWMHLYELPVYQPLSGMLSAAHPLLFGLAPFFKLFEVLGFDLSESHSLYLMSTLYLNALGHFLLLRMVKVSRILAFILSLFVMLWGLNILHFIWPHFLSLFWMPFALCCLISWVRHPRWLSGLGVALCSGMLFAVNEYYGVFFMVFILFPLIIFFFLKLWKKKHLFLSLLLPLLLVGVAILLLYAPMLDHGLQAMDGSRSFDTQQLIGADDLFCYSRPLSQFFPEASFPGHSLYLGIGFAILLLSFFAAPFSHVALIWSGLVALFAAAAVLYFISPFWLLIITLCLLVSLAILSWKGGHHYDLWGHLSVWISGAFLFILWGMPQLDPQGHLSLYRLIWKYLPVFGGVRMFDRVFPLLLPFLLILAARGMQMLWNRGIKRALLACVFALALLLMMVEHIEQNQFKQLAPLPLRPAAYGAIAAEERGTLLALPLYQGFVRLEDNARYMANQGYHSLSMLGGISSMVPDSYLPELQALTDHGRLTEKSLRRLLEEHSLSHLIVHWDWMDYIYGGAASEHMVDFKKRLDHLKEWLRLVYTDQNTSLYQVLDPIESSVFVRTFSRGQVLGNALQIRILSGGGEALTWSVDGRAIRNKMSIGPERVVEIGPGKLPVEDPTVIRIWMDEPARLDIRMIKAPVS